MSHARRRSRRRNRGSQIGGFLLSSGRHFGMPISRSLRDYLQCAVSEGTGIPETDRWTIECYLHEAIARKSAASRWRNHETFSKNAKRLGGPTLPSINRAGETQ